MVRFEVVGLEHTFEIMLSNLVKVMHEIAKLHELQKWLGERIVKCTKAE